MANSITIFKEKDGLIKKFFIQKNNSKYKKNRKYNLLDKNEEDLI